MCQSSAMKVTGVDSLNAFKLRLWRSTDIEAHFWPMSLVIHNCGGKKRGRKAEASQTW